MSRWADRPVTSPAALSCSTSYDQSGGYYNEAIRPQGRTTFSPALSVALVCALSIGMGTAMSTTPNGSGRQAMQSAPNILFTIMIIKS
jgi:hypothetical protein